MMTLLPLVGASHGGRHSSHPYTAAEIADRFCTFDDGIPLVTGSAHACFDILAGESSVDLVLDDAADLPVPGFYEFFDSTGSNFLGDGTFCGAVTLTIPSGATYLDVIPFPPGFAPLVQCPTPPTVGYIRAAFT